MNHKMKALTLDYETADRIAMASLGDLIQDLESEIAMLRHELNTLGLKEYQQRDLTNKEEMLEAVQKVFCYYGGNCM